jgi:hypothetical protein
MQAGLLPLCREVVHQLVEYFTAAHPTPHLAPEERADLFESLSAFRVLLAGHGLVDLTESVLASRGHPPGEEAPAAGIGPRVILGC